MLRPAQITDPNGNQSSAGYTPLGMPAWIAKTGKRGGSEGDTLAQPGTVFSYDLTAWDDNPSDRQPVSVQTTRRINHRWALVDAVNAQRAAQGLPPLTAAQLAAMFPPDEVTSHPDRFIRKTEFTDGFGRLSQTRVQADDIILDDLGLTADMTAPPGPVETHPQDPAAPPQVVVSGWQMYDNKGRVVQKWEPCFDAGWAYQPPPPRSSPASSPRSSSATTRAGWRSRPSTRTDPSGVLVPGIPADLTNPAMPTSPPRGRAYSYDNNDNAGPDQPRRLGGLVIHWNTPSSDLVDPLGRVIEHIERTATTMPSSPADAYDIDGNLLQVTDALGRVASLQVYDLRGRPWRQQVIDAGTVRTS